VAVLGLSLLLAGAHRTSRRGRDARRGLAQSRRETAAVSQERDDLIGQRDAARGYTVHDEQQNFTASTPSDDGTARNGSDPGLRGPSLSERLFGRRPAHPQAAPQSAPLPSQALAASAQPGPPVGQSAADSPAGASAPADDSREKGKPPHEYNQEARARVRTGNPQLEASPRARSASARGGQR
jgi:hypothetical protein